MPNYSPFQTLPLYIAEAIARYYIPQQSHPPGFYHYRSKRPINNWFALHDISYNWMQLARINLYKHFTLCLSTDPDDDRFEITHNSRRVIEQRTLIIPYIQKFHIHIEDIVEEPNKDHLDELDRVWPKNIVFTNVRSVFCYFGDDLTDASNNANNDRYFQWVIERVRSSFPNLQETTIEFGGFGEMTISPGVLFSEDWNASLYISALFQIVREEEEDILIPAHADNMRIIINNAPEVTNFSYYDRFNYDFASWVTKRSARTLEKLRYGEKGGGGGFQDFMFGDNGQVIVYPRLRELHVLDYNNNIGEFTTDESVVPFPVLERLTVNSRCVFEDDTLFRGSCDTLMSLDIGLHRGFVDIFRNYKVFSQGTYPKLFHIAATHDNRPGLTISADEFTKAAFALVSSTTLSIKFVGNTFYQHIRSVVPTCPYLENIQTLHLEKTRLSLLEILNTLKYFPRVTHFGCIFEGVDSELNMIQDKLIPSHLGKQYSQLRSRLKCWHMYYRRYATDKVIAVLFVTLAILCPNFTYVKKGIYDREEYASKIESILSSGLYDEHAKRLGCIFDLNPRCMVDLEYSL